MFFTDFDEANLVSLFNVELVNTLVNLLSRCRGNKLNPDGILPPFDQDEFSKRASEADQDMWKNLDSLPGTG